MKTANNNSSKSNSQNAHAQSSQFNDMLSKSGLTDLPHKLQQFGNTTMNKVSNLSTTQKVVGGTLLALGAGWLTMNTQQGKNMMSKIRTNRNS